MSTRPLPREFVAREWHKVLIEAIDALQSLDRETGLNRLQAAALNHLESVYMRSVRHANAVITRELIARPLAVAHRAMEAAACAH